MTEISRILADYPEVKVEELNANPPSFCDPDHEMVGILQRNAEMTSGVTPPPIISLAGTDARLWRYP
ncbi:hypothetical protein IVB38_04360 [Bradyrhizobium sp. 38]|uniref:hypothetical protein n=1 Tax=unclassified Bradyrhizobium TaxID=2631580 RepID=UPI001FF78188|nr:MULTISPECIES: hypothetical protein [unclassified Bradyrhizobium]MCK1335287.1 hypothetical protein [Bradyrhizobium sp. 38]MCK1775338.1 hypothetical protein [Bradyrhizobium sp. 132]